MTIHPLAAVSSSADVAQDVEIGPFCVVEAGAKIGAGCKLESHAVIKRGTTLGEGNVIHEGAVLGGLPQLSRQVQQPGGLQIGSHNTIREYATIHCSMYADKSTVIGDHNLLMAGVHVAHDCRLASQIIIANNTMLAGHVTIEDRAYISGAVGVHQFCRVGALAMVGGQAHVTQDIPPFVTVDGDTTTVVGLNLVGLRRAGYSVEQVRELKAAYRMIYRSGLPWNAMLELLRAEFRSGLASRFHDFLSAGKRGFVQERRPASATKSIPLHAVQLADDGQHQKAG